MTQTLLYIEDDTDNIHLIERLLARRPGIRLLVGRTASDGIAVAVTERPDLILLDNHLPDGTGSEVIERLAAATATETIPVVIVSGDPPASAASGPATATSADYLGKPFRMAEFFDMIDRHLPGAATEGS